MGDSLEWMRQNRDHGWLQAGQSGSGGMGDSWLYEAGEGDMGGSRLVETEEGDMGGPNLDEAEVDIGALKWMRQEKGTWWLQTG